MISSEINLRTCTTPVALTPRWLPIPAAVNYSGICRATLYKLANELGPDGRPKIQTACIKAHKGATRGRRLFDRESIDQFLLGLAERKEGAPN